MSFNDNTENRAPAGGATILVLGILGLVFCGVCAPFAWIRGNRALRLMDDGEADVSERGLVLAGRACGVIGTFLLAITLFILYTRATDTASHMH